VIASRKHLFPLLFGRGVVTPPILFGVSPVSASLVRGNVNTRGRVQLMKPETLPDGSRVSAWQTGSQALITIKTDSRSRREFRQLCKHLSVAIQDVQAVAGSCGTYTRDGNRTVQLREVEPNTFRCVGSGPALEKVCSHWTVNSWEVVVSGPRIPYGGAGQGDFTPASERREKEARREGTERGGEKRRGSTNEYFPDEFNVQLGNAADGLGIARSDPVLLPLLAEYLREMGTGTISARGERIREFLGYAIRADTLTDSEKERTGYLASHIFVNSR